MSDTLIAKSSRWALACMTLAGIILLSQTALAQQGYPGPQGGQSNPMCGRLEGQLAMIDRGGGGDPARAEQIRRYEDAAGKQQAELDRVTTQARRMGCDSSGFFSMFSGQAPQCGPLNTQIQQMRGNLDQLTVNLERLRVGTSGGERDGQRRSVLLALAQNNCGPQYAAAARGNGGSGGGGGFFDNLFGNNNNNGESPPPSMGDVPVTPSGTYRTVCARTCDGYYFPVSFATVPGRFADDERTCKSLCPAAEATLFTYRNPGEDMNQAVSINGAPYSSSPNAFRYRQEYIPTCSCKAAGQTWSEALKAIDSKESLGQGDIIVTEERAKKMAQPPTKGSTAPRSGTAAPANAAAPAQAPATDGKIRAVGPTFLPNAR